MPHLDIYQRAADRWAWRLVADNNHILATDGGQGYENQADCEEIALTIIGGHYRPRPQGVPVISSQHVDVFIAHEDPDTTQAETTDQEPERADVAPAPEWRIVLLARTKQEGLDEAAQRGFTPAAIVTPRSLDAARGMTADEIIVSSALTDEERDTLMPHAMPAVEVVSRT
jgi:uncharacterized protein YegP (UPF0339 family)